MIFGSFTSKSSWWNPSFLTLNMYHDVVFSHHFWGIGNSHFAQVRDVHRLERIGAEAWKVKNDEGQEFPSGLSLKHF